MNELSQKFTDYFVKKGTPFYWNKSESECPRISAAIFFKAACFPTELVFIESGVIIRCICPIRIPQEKIAGINELIDRLNNDWTAGKYGLDCKSQMVYCDLLMDANEWEGDDKAADTILEFIAHMATRLFQSVTFILYKKLNLEKAVASIDLDEVAKIKSNLPIPETPVTWIRGPQGTEVALN